MLAPRLDNVIIAENEATNHGGAIYVVGPRVVRLSSATIADNVADSDMVEGGRGGGIMLGPECSGAFCVGHAFLRGSLVASNLSWDDRDSDDCQGELASQGYLLMGVASSGIHGECHVGGDLTGVVFDVDPGLDSLGQHGGAPIGGGAAPTYSLLPGSPAIDAGNPAGCTDTEGQPLALDQRYAPRVGTCDVGAFEAGSLPNPPLFADGFESGGTLRWTTTSGG